MTATKPVSGSARRLSGQRHHACGAPASLTMGMTRLAEVETNDVGDAAVMAS